MSATSIFKRFSTIVSVALIFIATGCASVTDPNANLETEFGVTERIEFQFEEEVQDPVQYEDEEEEEDPPPLAD